MNSRPEESDEDLDSLFGSPPPSPRLTGMASPTLALPSMGSSGSRLSASTAPATKNVGTIALPGSHPDSEFPINPLALSLNHAIVQRPPAHVPPTLNTMGTTSWQRNNGQQIASTSQSPFTSIGSRSSKPKPKKKKSQQPSQPIKEPPRPEFALPDPSAPPPSNFLRNQEKLLGKAGLVAGVRPSTLKHTQTRGSTPSNPILVNDDDDAPTLGRRKAQARETSQPYIDPSLLVAPTNEEIVSVLIAQKDIFPILQGVLKLVLGNLAGLNLSTTTPPQPTGFQRTGPPGHATPTTDTSSGQPVKKRKLNRVPAGATDWDVPYPFEQGEGPDAYRQNWKRERGKQLISQLMKLIKTAARKAATKKYLQQEKERRGPGEKEHRSDSTSKDGNNKNQRKSHYKPETATYGIDTSSSTQTPTGGNVTSQSSDPIQTQQPTLEGMLGLKNLPSFDTVDLTGFGDLTTHLATSTDLQSPTTLDSASFDDLMDFFTNTFPTSFDGTSSVSVDSTPTSHSSTPGPDDFSFSNFFPQPTLGESTLDPNLSTSTSDLSAMLSLILNQPQTSPLDSNSNFPPPPSVADSVIDPSLLALSNPLNLDTAFMDSSITPPNYNPIAQVVSPIPSTSSFSGNDPATPASANWDVSMPDVFMASASASADGDTNGQEWNADENDFGPLPDFVGNGSGLLGTMTTTTTVSVDKGKGRAMDVDMDVTNVATNTTATTVSAAQEAVRALLGSSSTPINRNLSTASTPLEKARATRKLRKDDIIRRAQEKRDRLQEELNKVKLQLWETTLEQAGLMQLARQLDGVDNVTTEGSGSGGRVS